MTAIKDGRSWRHDAQRRWRFDNAETEAPPLVCLQHFRGNPDNWDPALVDRYCCWLRY
jgi:hypothetical protein